MCACRRARAEGVRLLALVSKLVGVGPHVRIVAAVRSKKWNGVPDATAGLSKAVTASAKGSKSKAGPMKARVLGMIRPHGPSHT